MKSNRSRNMTEQSPVGEEAQRRVQAACTSARAVLRQCGGDQVQLSVAFQAAVIAFHLRGNTDTRKNWAKDAAALNRGLNALQRHRERVLGKLAPHWFQNPETGEQIGMMRGIGTTHLLAPEAVLAAVVQAIKQVAADLDQPHAANLLRERRDAQFLRLLGIEFRKRNLLRPPIGLLKKLHECATGEPFDGGDDAAALHAFGRRPIGRRQSQPAL